MSIKYLIWMYVPICGIAMRQSISQWQDGDGSFWLLIGIAFGILGVGIIVAPIFKW